MNDAPAYVIAEAKLMFPTKVFRFLKFFCFQIDYNDLRHGLIDRCGAVCVKLRIQGFTSYALVEWDDCVDAFMLDTHISTRCYATHRFVLFFKNQCFCVLKMKLAFLFSLIYIPPLPCRMLAACGCPVLSGRHEGVTRVCSRD